MLYAVQRVGPNTMSVRPLAIVLALVLLTGVLPIPGTAHWDPPYDSPPVVFLLRISKIRPVDIAADDYRNMGLPVEGGTLEFRLDFEGSTMAGHPDADFESHTWFPMKMMRFMKVNKDVDWGPDGYRHIAHRPIPLSPATDEPGDLHEFVDEKDLEPFYETYLKVLVHAECSPLSSPFVIHTTAEEIEPPRYAADAVGLLGTLLSVAAATKHLAKLNPLAMAISTAVSATLLDKPEKYGQDQITMQPGPSEGVPVEKEMQLRGPDGGLDVTFRLVWWEYQNYPHPQDLDGLQLPHRCHAGSTTDETALDMDREEDGPAITVGSGAQTLQTAALFTSVKKTIAQSEASETDAPAADLMISALGAYAAVAVDTAQGHEGAIGAVELFNAGLEASPLDKELAASLYELAVATSLRAIASGAPQTDSGGAAVRQPIAVPAAIHVDETGGETFILDPTHLKDGPKIAMPDLPEGWEFVQVSDETQDEPRVEPVMEYILSKMYGECRPTTGDPSEPAEGKTDEGCAAGEERDPIGHALEVLLKDDESNDIAMPDPLLKKEVARYELLPPPDLGPCSGLEPFSQAWWYCLWDQIFKQPPKVHYFIPSPAKPIEIPIEVPKLDTKKENESLEELERETAIEVGKAYDLKGFDAAAEAYLQAADEKSMLAAKQWLQVAREKALLAQEMNEAAESPLADPLPLAGAPKDLVLTGGQTSGFAIVDPLPRGGDTPEITIEAPGAGLTLLPPGEPVPEGKKEVGLILTQQVSDEEADNIAHTFLLFFSGQLFYTDQGMPEDLLDASDAMKLDLEPESTVESVIDDLQPIVVLVDDPRGGDESPRERLERVKRAAAEEAIRKALEGSLLKIKKGVKEVTIPLSYQPPPPAPPTAEEEFLAWLEGLVGPWNEEITKGNTPAFLKRLRGESLLVADLRSGDQARVLFHLAPDKTVESLTLINAHEKVKPHVTVTTKEHVLRGLLAAEEKTTAVLLALEQGTLDIDDTDTLGAAQNWLAEKGARIAAKFTKGPYDVKKDEEKKVQYAVPSTLGKSYLTPPAPRPATYYTEYLPGVYSGTPGGMPAGVSPPAPAPQTDTPGGMPAGAATLTKNTQGHRVLTPPPGTSLAGLHKSLVPNVPKEDIRASTDQFGSTTGYTTQGNLWLLASKPPTGYIQPSNHAGWFNNGDPQGTYFGTNGQNYQKYGSKPSAGAVYISAPSGFVV